MNTKNKELILVGFLQAQNCSIAPMSWRYPGASLDFLRPGHYQHIARVLEAGKFHLAFFDDRLAIPDRYEDSYVETIRYGIRSVKLDLIPLLTAMGLSTERLGLGGTYSTTYYEPFHVARLFSTLDHMLSGRVAWNVVTSLNDSEAANFGYDSHLEHDARYDRADEFHEVVLGHWDSCQEVAIVPDQESGVFGDPSKVGRLDHKGKFFKSRGPFTLPRTPQGRPVLIQAGQSGRGLQFASRWSEVVFVVFASLEIAKASYKKYKAAFAAAGRDPAETKVAPLIYTVVGETQTIAEERANILLNAAKPIDTLVLLSEVLNFDFSSRPLDLPFTDEELKGISGLKAISERVTQLSGKRNPSAGDFVSYIARGTLREIPHFVGTAKQIADGLEQWFVEEACDGFVLGATHVPGSYEDFVRLVVPELQRRGLFRKEYEGQTLRENLGLKRAEPFDWKRP